MTQQSSDAFPITLFYSYAHEDEILRNELEKHLSLLRRQGIISTWHNRRIAPGTDWLQEIGTHLNSSSVILLLISPDFLASDYRYGIEMQRALERQKKGEVYVIPVLLRAVDLQDAPFAYLQSLPRDGKPVTSWANLDEAFYDIARGIRQVIEHLRKVDRTLPLPPLPSWTVSTKVSSLSRTNRERMLKRVRAFWIKGVLEQSLHHFVLIALGLHEQPDAVASPWRLVMQETEQPARPLPAGTHITEVYNDADGELLILGEPGAGKTTLLLELARDLLDYADQDPIHPIPVVFNLSSWAVKRPSFKTWLVEELNLKYQVPRKVGQAWIDANEILPLLDGLDEVAEQQRSACIEVINAYRHEHAGALVVCSRRAEYQAQTARIVLQRAVLILPLSAQQVDDYLSSAGRRLEAVQEALRLSPELQEMTQTPLMLNILALAYQDKPVTNLQENSPSETLQQEIFATYVQRMLLRRREETYYTSQQTVHWLAWLAQQMIKKNQTDFYLERMQIDWFSDHPFYRHLLSTSTGLLIAFFGWISYSIFYWNKFGLVRGITDAAFGCLIFVIIYVLVNSVLLPLLEKQKRVIQQKSDKIEKRSWISASRLLTSTLGTRWGYSLLIGVPSGSIVGFIMGQAFGIIAGSVYGLTNVLMLSLEFFAFNKFSVEIKPVEIVAWSWISVWRNLRNSVLSSLGFALLMGTLFVIDPSFGIKQGIPIGLLYGVAFFIVTNLMFWGASHDLLKKTEFDKPNQGIRRSTMNCFFSGIRILCLSSLLIWLIQSLFGRPVEGIIYYGVVTGVVLGGVRALWGGGFAIFQHYLVRIILVRARYVPWNYVRFLDYAADRILLRKVGGGYIFVHRLLLDYFSSLKQKK